MLVDFSLIRLDVHWYSGTLVHMLTLLSRCSHEAKVTVKIKGTATGIGLGEDFPFLSDQVFLNLFLVRTARLGPCRSVAPFIFIFQRLNQHGTGRRLSTVCKFTVGQVKGSQRRIGLHLGTVCRFTGYSRPSV